MMRRNDIENIARILRKRSPVRVGTIVGFENDGKVVQVRFHDTKLPEGQFERKLACEGIIEGSVFTLIQPNFRRPVSDLVDIEKEVGAGALKGLTLPLVGFETYPEGSENPDCIIGLFELPGGSIYREVLAEARNDILIPGYGTFPSQKVIGEDEIRRIELMPWFGPHRFGTLYKIASVNNKSMDHLTKEGLHKIGPAFLDKVRSFVTASDHYIEPDMEVSEMEEGIYEITSIQDPFGLPNTDRHLIYHSGKTVLFCEGISLFEYFKRKWNYNRTYEMYSQTSQPVGQTGNQWSANQYYTRSRRAIIKSGELYMSQYLAQPWIRNSSYFVPDPLMLSYEESDFLFHGAFQISKITYDLSMNIVKLEGTTAWLETPSHSPGPYPASEFTLEFVNDPMLVAAVPKLSKDGRYFGIERYLTAEEYENNGFTAYPVFVPESKPVSVNVSMQYTNSCMKYYQLETRVLQRVVLASSEPVILLDEDIEINTQEMQVLVAEGRFRPYFIIDIPERLENFKVGGNFLVHNWERDSVRFDPSIVPHVEEVKTGLTHSFLDQETFQKEGKAAKTEIELKLSNIDLPTFNKFTITSQLRAFNYSAGVKTPFFTKDLSKVGKTETYNAFLGKLGIGFMNWNFDFRAFNNYGAYGMNNKIYSSRISKNQVKEMFFAGTMVEGKPYRLTDFDFTDPNILMNYSYGERNLEDYNYNPANGGLAEQIDTFKTTRPRYDTGANATYRWDPDDIAIEIDHVDVYKIAGASYDFWTGYWNWTWESTPCRVIPGNEVEKVEPYPNIRVPILASELKQLSGRWHLPRLHIYYKRVKAGAGLSSVPYFYFRFRSPIEALAELEITEAVKVLYPGSYGLFNPGETVWPNINNKLMPIIEPIYGAITFPETSDELMNSIRADMTGIVGASSILGYLVKGWNLQVGEYLYLDGPFGHEEAFFIPMEKSPDHTFTYGRGNSSSQTEEFPISEEMVQKNEAVGSDCSVLPADLKITRVRLDRAKLMFDKLILNDDLTSNVINPAKFGIKEE